MKKCTCIDRDSETMIVDPTCSAPHTPKPQKIEGGRKNDMLEIGNMTCGGLKPTKIITDEKNPIFKMYQDKDKTLRAVIFTEKGIWKLTKDN